MFVAARQNGNFSVPSVLFFSLILLPLLLLRRYFRKQSVGSIRTESCVFFFRLSWWRYKLRKINLKCCKSSSAQPQKYEAKRNKIVTNYTDRYMFNWLQKFRCARLLCDSFYPLFLIDFFALFFSRLFDLDLFCTSLCSSLAGIHVPVYPLCVTVIFSDVRIQFVCVCVKSVHWVCNIYYGWWWKAVRLFYVYSKQ